MPLIKKYNISWHIGASLGLGLLVGACTTTAYTPDVAQRHPIVVKQAQQSMRLVVGARKTTLTRAQQNDLRAFASAYQDHGYGPLALSLPQKGRHSSAVRAAADQAKKALIANGLDWAVITEGHYDGPQAQNGSILLTFTRYVAQAKDCGQSWDNLAQSYNNRPSKNFGCALAANTAAMIADPYDLVQPRAQDPSSGARRQVIMDKYIAGKTTASEKSKEAQGTISDAVK